MKDIEKSNEQSNTRLPTKVDPAGFPHPPSAGGKAVPATIENVAHLLMEKGIQARFNIVKKRLELSHTSGATVSMNEVASLALLNGIGTNWLYPFVGELGSRNPYSPVATWIGSKPWDHKDRLQELYDTVRETKEYPAGLKEILLRRWLLSATKAALANGPFRARGVLTFQGPQGVGKTSWISALMPKGRLREDSLLLDHHLDGSNKDSVINAISHWIVEIGELDSSFKKDVARLKGFLTNDCDKLRKPYGRDVEDYPRRTVFAATVNEERFLVDHTGNSRWWTIAVESFDFQHGIDMQQVYAQLAVALDGEDQWWLTQAEEKRLADYNQRHRSTTLIAELFADEVDIERAGNGPFMTPTEVLRRIGVEKPTNAQCKECGGLLRELIGRPSRIHGRDKWRVPWRDPTDRVPTSVTLRGPWAELSEEPVF